MTITASPNRIVQNLDMCIEQVAQNIKCYCYHPLEDFTRNRKLTVNVLMKLIIQLGAKSMKSELCDHFVDARSLPTDSAVSQQRDKLMPEAFARVLYLFNRSVKHDNLLKGYYLLACDGSDVNIPFDASDIETLLQSRNNKPYSQVHLNALYDCLNHIYWDINIDTATKTREADALKDMIIKHDYPSPSIITADRGYEGYDLIACCQNNNQKFVIRVKDKDSRSSILRNLELPEGECDIEVKRILTRKATNEIKADKKTYVILSNKNKFTYLDVTEDFYELGFRVVRFQLDNGIYESVVTNLSKDEFSLREMKKLYHMRWEIETSFKKLKYNIGLVHFHSKKREFIKQEIYAHVILYNLTNMIAMHVETKVKGKKYDLHINFALAVTNIRLFLSRRINQAELIRRIKKYLVPIRPDRSFMRNVKSQSAKAFDNRIA